MDERFIDWFTFQKAQQKYPKYCTLDRWEYYKRVRDLCPAGSILEVGPFRQALTRGQMYLDVKDWAGIRPLLLIDLDKDIPIADDSFDVVIALQVIEHLATPRTVIDRFLNIAPTVIVSIPWKWVKGDPGHIGLNEDTAAEWFWGHKITHHEYLGDSPFLRAIFKLNR